MYSISGAFINLFQVQFFSVSFLCLFSTWHIALCRRPSAVGNLVTN
jgi:hypothetical protein